MFSCGKTAIVALYSGPYPILARSNKFFTLDFNTRVDTVSIDRLFVEQEQTQATAPPPSTTVASQTPPSFPPSAVTAPQVPPTSSTSRATRYTYSQVVQAPPCTTALADPYKCLVNLTCNLFLYWWWWWGGGGGGGWCGCSYFPLWRGHVLWTLNWAHG